MLYVIKERRKISRKLLNLFVTWFFGNNKKKKKRGNISSYLKQVSFFSTSPELSNKQRFEYFTRTIPSDHHQVKAMVEIVKRLGWSYVSIIYEESNYGIKIITFKKKIMVRTSDFKSITKTLAFVDKTLFIKEILQGGSLKVITVPRKFGKSSNQDMLRLFLSIPLNPLTGIHLKKNISENFELFKGLRINQEEPEFVQNTLATFPVINVNFRAKKPISTIEECVEILSHKIHKAFVPHEYLCISHQLSEYEREVCKTWCREGYRSQGEKEVVEGLALLAACLYKHHNHTVITLVDDYDSLVTAATFMASDIDLQAVVCFVMKIISTMVKNNGFNCRSVVVGSSILPTLGTPKVEKFVFLGNHSLDGYYGFTAEEVKHLLNNPEFQLDKEDIRRSYQMYWGYETKTGSILYATYSVLRFLLLGKAKPYWEPSVYVETLMNAYSIPAVEEKIDTLLKDKTLGLLLPNKLSLSDFLLFRKMSLMKSSCQTPNVELFLLHLLELGYLTYHIPKVASDLKKTYVKLPNGEIKSIILEYLWNIQVFSNLSKEMKYENEERMEEEDGQNIASNEEFKPETK